MEYCLQLHVLHISGRSIWKNVFIQKMIQTKTLITFSCYWSYHFHQKKQDSHICFCLLWIYPYFLFHKIKSCFQYDVSFKWYMLKCCRAEHLQSSLHADQICKNELDLENLSCSHWWAFFWKYTTGNCWTHDTKPDRLNRLLNTWC